jgi:hypothetical protein
MVSSQTTPRSARKLSVSGGGEEKEGKGGRRTLVTHVMDLVENDPSNLTHDLGTAVKHRTKNLFREDVSTSRQGDEGGTAHLGSHDQAGCGRVNRNISRHQSDVSKLRKHLTILLVGKRLWLRGKRKYTKVSKRERTKKARENAP